MKLKILSIILGIALLAFAAQAQAGTIDINVLSPNGGEFISQANGNYRIQFQIFDSNNELDVNASIYYTPPLTNIIQNLSLKTQANCTSLDFTTNPSCYYDWNTAGINGVFKIGVSINDSDGNTANDESDNSATIDNTAPSGLSILINNGEALTNNPQASLSLAANSDANQMQFSCDNSSYSSFENFASTKAFNLNSGSGCTSGDGNKTVYFKAKDKAGNASAVAADSIILDSIAPIITIVKPTANSYDNNSRQTIQTKFSDSSSGFNLSTLNFKVQNSTYNIGSANDYSLNFATDSNTLTFTPKFDYNNMQAVSVHIDLNDYANNKTSADWSFTIDKNSANAISDLNGSIQGNESIALSWSAPGFEGAGISHYKVYKSTAPITQSSRTAFFYLQTSSTSFSDFNIEKGKTYYYYATSIDSAGNESQLSNEKTFAVEGFVKITADNNSFSMQEGTSQSISLEIFNDSKKTQKITLDIDTDDSDLIAELGSDELSLNKNEKTSIGLSIIAQEGVSSGNHAVTVTMNYGSLERTLTINIQVGGILSLVSFEALETVICNDDFTLRIPVDVSNLSGSTKNITLKASNNTFLPRWDDDFITLTSGEAETIDLLLNNTPSSELSGDYNIQVSAESGSSIAVDRITITLEDCEGSADTADFSLSIDASRIDLGKGSAGKINYRISNTESFGQYINVSIETELSTDYNSLVFVNANSTLSDTAIVRAGALQDAKDYDFKIKASNDETSHERTVIVKVLPTHYFEFSIPEQDFDLMQGQSKSLSIEFKNADYTETFTIELENTNSGINAILSETSFTLSPKTSRKISLSISADEDTALGSKTIKVKARTNSISQKTLEARLNVKEAIPTPESLLLEIESYPSAVHLNPGESKELMFVIFNPAKNAAFARISLEGLPEGVSFEEALETIAGNQRKTITGTLKARENAQVGEFEIPISFEAFGLRQAKSLELSIGQQGLLTAIIAGFLSLGESVWLGVLAIIVIVMLIWLFGKLAAPSKPKEPWMQK